LFPPDFQRHLQKQSHRRRRHAGQYHGNLGIMAQSHVGKAKSGDNHRPGQDHAEGCRQRARRPAQPATDNHAHVRGVQTGQGLRNFQRRHEAVLIEPLLFVNQCPAQVGNNAAAEAGHPDQGKNTEQFAQ
jgi:hypothetical protein